MNTFVIALSDAAATLENVGGKGMSLAKLLSAQLPVPPGSLVLTNTGLRAPWVLRRRAGGCCVNHSSTKSQARACSALKPQPVPARPRSSLAPASRAHNCSCLVASGWGAPLLHDAPTFVGGSTI